MPNPLDEKLVVGISSRALFNLEEENKIYENEGLEAYTKYQREHENDILKPGTAFPLVKALHGLNRGGKRKVEVIIMSRNSADTSLRIFNSIKHYGLDIEIAALAGGESTAKYLAPFNTDLFLSANESDVQDAINAGTAAGLICSYNKEGAPEATSGTGCDAYAGAEGNLQDISRNDAGEFEQIRIAFDGDAVIFSDESEKIYKEQGLEAFSAHELENARNPLPAGPFAKLLRTISNIQKEFYASLEEENETSASDTDINNGEAGDETKTLARKEENRNRIPIRTALVTARSAPAHERVLRTLQAWDVIVDDAFFMAGADKTAVLKAFGAHIFFDDQTVHLDRASKEVPSARVPYKEA